QADERIADRQTDRIGEEEQEREEQPGRRINGGLRGGQAGVKEYADQNQASGDGKKNTLEATQKLTAQPILVIICTSSPPDQFVGFLLPAQIGPSAIL